MLTPQRLGLVPGLTGSQIQTVLEATLREADLRPVFALVAIGAEAASPHGGFGGEAKLTAEDLVLIDVGYVTSCHICDAIIGQH